MAPTNGPRPHCAPRAATHETADHGDAAQARRPARDFRLGDVVQFKTAAGPEFRRYAVVGVVTEEVGSAEDDPLLVCKVSYRLRWRMAGYADEQVADGAELVAAPPLSPGGPATVELRSVNGEARRVPAGEAPDF